jgi:hypothetical protein
VSGKRRAEYEIWERCCRTCWSPRQESNLYLALRRHLFYPLNYGEIDLVTGKAETFSINLLTLPMGISGFFCFVLNEAP